MALKAPRTRLLGNVGQIEIYEVNGKEVRDGPEPEFTNFAEHYRFPDLIPENEYWVDVEVAKDDEWPAFIVNMNVYHHCRADGVAHEAAVDRAGQAEKKFRLRTEPSKILHTHHFIVEHITTLGAISVDVVDGRAIRDDLYIDWTEGGHDLRYKFQPKNSIWIDNDLAVSERMAVIVHEAVERMLMALGWSYERAHEFATLVERAYRRDKQ
jgi:hypothetical protein